MSGQRKEWRSSRRDVALGQSFRAESFKAQYFRTERGSTLVEASIALPVFLAILFIGLELLIVAYNHLAVQYVASASINTALVGESGDGQARAAAIATSARKLLGRFGLSEDRLRICLSPLNSNACDNEPGDAGGPDQVIRIQIEYKYSLFRAVRYTIEGEAIGRSERYSVIDVP